MYFSMKVPGSNPVTCKSVRIIQQWGPTLQRIKGPTLQTRWLLLFQQRGQYQRSVITIDAHCCHTDATYFDCPRMQKHRRVLNKTQKRLLWHRWKLMWLPRIEIESILIDPVEWIGYDVSGNTLWNSGIVRSIVRTWRTLIGSWHGDRVRSAEHQPQDYLGWERKNWYSR